MAKNILSGRKLIKRADFRKILVCMIDVLTMKPSLLDFGKNETPYGE